MKPLLIILLAALLHNFILAQNGQRKFTHLTVDNGLSANTVLSIVQDSKGFLWVGTYDGLNRYDGYTFKVFKHNERDNYSLSDNKVFKLLEDLNGNIWIGTWGGGLNKFDRKTEKFTRFLNIPKDSSTLSSNTIYDLSLGKAKNIFIATLGGGICSLNIETELIKRYLHIPGDSLSLISNDVRTLTLSTKDELWIGTDIGLDKFNFQNENFSHYPLEKDITCI
ncbi:MAG: two-component regulator propeller domain-containing protein, partial [Nitrososphaeraceae archaeon]|nr:two-component regulator propeller domain-containing protein [Nitrososphaeraceae archaeon]